jgi:hypothetical protein
VNGSPLTEVVGQITWTATGDAAIKSGQFQEFPVSMGPLPKVDQMVFKALQTYSDGTVVRWIEEPAAGAEPQKPAPVLKLTAPTAAGTGTPASPAAASGVPTVAVAGSTPSGPAWVSYVALGAALAALALALAALALGGVALARARRQTRMPAV